MKTGTKRLSTHVKFVVNNGIEISDISIQYYINKNNLSDEMGSRLLEYFGV